MGTLDKAGRRFGMLLTRLFSPPGGEAYLPKKSGTGSITAAPEAFAVLLHRLRIHASVVCNPVFHALDDPGGAHSLEERGQSDGASPLG